MPRTVERLTKARVREEIADLRKRIDSICQMNDSQLAVAFLETFPGNPGTVPQGKPGELRHSLLLYATYKMAQYLNVE